jgi:hypothetical protein
MPQNKILFFILSFLLETNLGFFYAPMKCNSVKTLYNINVLSPFNFIEYKERLPADLAALGKASDRPKGDAAPLKNKTRDIQVEMTKQSLVLSNKALKESETSSD